MLFFLDRFKSIAKSYFRRADGVLLLYDVTCEKSFLNVREWVDTIEVCLALYCLKEQLGVFNPIVCNYHGQELCLMLEKNPV